MTTLMKQKQLSRSYDQDKLKILSDLICDNIEELLVTLEINDFKFLDKMIIMSCPIHGGDNESAFNLYHKGDSYRGNWKCRTHQCENIFRSSVIGFIRGCLSKKYKNWSKEGDPTITFSEAVEFATKFVNKDLNDIKIPKKEKEKNTFVNTINYLKSSSYKAINSVDRDKVKQSLHIPSEYFLKRNYTSEILIKYDVGDCLNPNREMYNRAVVPVYDNDHLFMVGCSGRTLNNNKPKWKHNDGFRAEEHLYNFWYAKEYIKQTGTVILVESPGNVWRLEEAGIHNSVALFGSSLKDKQKMLLDISGAMSIITIMDNDEAGQKAAQQIYAKCNRIYNIANIEIKDYEDIGEMKIEEINQIIKPQIEKIIK
ncbi:MAG: toprim domain-containing protein [Caulobacteraceae bacterium]|nr:toprim domain-containing protein [Caulobacteraceae bacterium]